MSKNLFHAVLILIPLGAVNAQIALTPSLSDAQLPPKHRDILRALGTRLSKPGKESYTLKGTLNLFSSGGQPTSSSAATIIWQYPGLLQAVLPGLNQTIVFNGSTVLNSLGVLQAGNMDLVESLTKDVMENFFLERLTGQTAQIIARSINVRDTRGSNRLSGQCDLLRVTELNGVRGLGTSTAKTFCFDPQSHLLHSVIYGDGSSVVETRFSNWQTINGDSYPAKIDRFSGATPVFSLTIDRIAIAGPQASTVFTVQ